MSIATYINEEGFSFRIFSSMYVDWGLEITDPDGNELYYSPSCLSNESYGQKPNPAKEFEDWDEAEEAAREGDEEAFVEWDANDWKERIKDEADEFLDAFSVSCKVCDKVLNASTAPYIEGQFYCPGCNPD